MSAPTFSPLPSGTCFVNASRTQLNKTIPSALRAPLLNLVEWRVGPAQQNPALMERRGWIQPVCLAVTTPQEIKEKSSSFERFYIPGEFCRQGDVLSAAAESGKMIMLERGAFLAPNDIRRAVDKISTAKKNVVLVEAGSAFGYSDRVLDPRALEIVMKLDCPVALNLNALSSAEGHVHAHRPDWIADPQFDVALVRTALAFGVQYLILPDARDFHPDALELWLSARKVVTP